MLGAVLADLLLLPEVQLCTTWAAGLPPLGQVLAPFLNGKQAADEQLFRRLQVEQVAGIDEEQAAFRRLAARADRLILIAPETDHVLTDRHQLALAVNPAAASRLSSPQAIALCSDKLRLTEELGTAGLPVIPTQLAGDSAGRLPPICPQEFPAVLKPRDGAGCLDTCVLRTASDYHSLRQAELIRSTGDLPRPEWILQPLLPGEALSTAALIDRDSGQISIFPVGTQLLRIDRQIEYLGGRLPAAGWTARVQQAAEQLVRRAVAAVPGLAGYVGFDLLLLSGTAHQPEPSLVLVEINPRLTTAWLGYRQLSASRAELAGMLAGVLPGPLPDWQPGPVGFLPDGTLTTPMAESC